MLTQERHFLMLHFVSSQAYHDILVYVFFPVTKGIRREWKTLGNFCIQKELHESPSTQIPIYVENKNRVESI